jgi:hypothetical protein
MIQISTNNMIYAACFTLILLICIYFLLTWQIKEIIRDELEKEKELSDEIKQKKLKEKRKKLMMLRQQQAQARKQDKNVSIDTFGNQSNMGSNMSNGSNFTDEFDDDMDSYIDPTQKFS